MAGTKGKSGGARENSGGARPNSGGARPGAGRPRKSKADPVPQGDVDMLQLLQNVALGKTEATMLQVRAAIAAVQYTHTKRGDGGKKEEQAAKAQKAMTGRFAPRPPPLALVKKGAGK